MAAVELRILSRDEDGMVELEVTVEGTGHCGMHRAYVYPDELQAFGAALQFYPFSDTKEAVLEAGSREPGWYGYMRLRVFLLSGFDSSAMEVQYDTNGEVPDMASVLFYVTGNPASFSRLGEEICRFSTAGDQPMRCEWPDA